MKKQTDHIQMKSSEIISLIIQVDKIMILNYMDL